MRRRLASGLAALSIGALAATGCSQAEDAASSAARDLASQAASRAATAAASKAGEVAKDVVRDQVCRIAADGKIDAQEAAAIRQAADAAERAGVPRDIVDAARAVATAGAEAPEQAVDRLRQECAKTP
jgi:hypothetical protein